MPPSMIYLETPNATYSAISESEVKLLLTKNEICLSRLDGIPQAMTASMFKAEGFSGDGIKVEPTRTGCYLVSYGLQKVCPIADFSCINSRPGIVLLPAYPTRSERTQFTLHSQPGTSASADCPNPPMTVGLICAPSGQKVKSVSIKTQAAIAYLAQDKQCISVGALFPARYIPALFHSGFPFQQSYYYCQYMKENVLADVVYEVIAPN